MDIVYTTTKAGTSSSPSSFLHCLKDVKCVVSVSNRNVVAFTSYTDLKDPSPKSWVVSIYVADLNVPNEVHQVTTHHEDITWLEWDFSGSRLLMGDVMGNIQIHSCRDNLLSSWKTPFEVQNHVAFAGEQVMSAVWFHPGIKVTVSADKKDNINWNEKFSWTNFGTSVKQFGRKASDGFLAISSSGLVYSLVVLGDGNVVTGTEVIGHFRSKLKAVDIAYLKDGKFLVVTSNGSVESSINCFTIQVKVTNGQPDRAKCTIICQPFSSFYLNSLDGHVSTDSEISHLKFVLKESPDAVIVTTSSAAGSTIELWELKEKPVTLHKVFSKKSPVPDTATTEETTEKTSETPTAEANGPSEEPMDTSEPPTETKKENPAPKVVSVWQRHASDTHSVPVSSLSTPKSSIIDSNSPASLILVSFDDNSIKCLTREGLKEVTRLSLNNSMNRYSSEGTKGGNKTADRNISLYRVTDMTFTSNGCAVIGITSNSDLITCRLLTVFDSSLSPNINSSCVPCLSPQTFLEYCLLTGNDWWDVQILFKASFIDSCFESLSNSFSKQSTSLQARLFIRLQELKGSLYRSLPATSSSSLGQVKAGDAHASIMLYSVATFLKSLLRARDNQEKEGPAENLSTLIQTKGKDFLNVDKVLMELEHKEFFVETIILQSLQNLNQWVADLTLYLLSTLPWQVHKNYRFPGGSLIHDTKSLNILRELLVVIRIWGLINESCLPLFTRLSGDLDVIAHLFKMLTVRVGTVGSEADESLLEECYRLPNQVLVNQPCLPLKARGVASPALYSIASNHSGNNHQGSHLPFQFNYFVECPQLKCNFKTYVIEGAVMYNLQRNMDVIRHLNLGRVNPNKHPNLKKCSRCQSMSQIQANVGTRTHAIRAWDQRFAMKCICSGWWQ